MINSIIDSISKKIYSEFGDGYKIYTEEVKQGLKTPCFFINCPKNEETLFRENKYFESNFLVVQYLTDSNNKKAECNDVKEKLFDLLEYVTFKDDYEDENLIRGTDMNSEYEDGLLTFFVNYNFYIYKNTKKEEKMETFNYAAKIGDDENGERN